ncbi:MAG: hypothetical protein RJP95_04650 [Pirellulales bacterium]
MTQPITIEAQIHFERRGRGGRKSVHKGDGPTRTPDSPGRVPRIARLMALAIRFDELIKAGEVADYAELARLAHVTRARITQIMNLRMLAPDIQEAILFLPRVDSGRDPIHLRQLQSIALVPDWWKQQRAWNEIRTNH